MQSSITHCLFISYLITFSIYYFTGYLDTHQGFWFTSLLLINFFVNKLVNYLVNMVSYFVGQLSDLFLNWSVGQLGGLLVSHQVIHINY